MSSTEPHPPADGHRHDADPASNRPKTLSEIRATYAGQADWIHQLEWADRLVTGPYRRARFGDVKGEVLDVACGTRTNFRYLPETVDLTAVLSKSLAKLDSDGVAVETDFPGKAPLRTDEETLRTTLVSPLENAVRYADSTVAVTIESTDAGYRVVISDDGPGIPDAELDSLAAGAETDLRHGRGLGLRQLRWGVDALDGDLSFETGDGTTVRIRLSDLDVGDGNGERA